MGTRRVSYNFFPKKYAVALKSCDVAGEHSTHSPSHTDSGTAENARLTVKRWMLGNDERSISCAEFRMVSAGGQPESGIAMFDCPEHNQTSPSRTFLIVSVVLSCPRFSSYGPPALGVRSLSIP